MTFGIAEELNDDLKRMISSVEDIIVYGNKKDILGIGKFVKKTFTPDLTNTYFEGKKQNGKLAKFGRIKEKRNDPKLVVLALVVNIEGFIKYSYIRHNNIGDRDTASTMIDKLAPYTCKDRKVVIVLDARFAT